MTITQFNLLSFKPVVPLFPIYYSFLNIRPPKLVTKRLSDIYIHISVAKPYGRFGQKLESLQGRSGLGTERVIQCRTGHGRGTDQKRQSKSMFTFKIIIIFETQLPHHNIKNLNQFKLKTVCLLLYLHIV